MNKYAIFSIAALIMMFLYGFHSGYTHSIKYTGYVVLILASVSIGVCCGAGVKELIDFFK